MADTQRTKSALATLLADNTSGAISPQDLRDLMESLHFSFGSLYISTPAETSIANQNEWTKVAGTTTDVNLHRFEGKTALAVDNRLKYTGAAMVHVHAVFNWSQTSASSNVEFDAAAYHYDDSAASGSILTHSIVRRKQGTGSDVGAAAAHFDVMMDTNDYVEMHVRNVTNDTNVTFQYAYMFIMGMFR